MVHIHIGYSQDFLAFNSLILTSIIFLFFNLTLYKHRLHTVSRCKAQHYYHSFNESSTLEDKVYSNFIVAFLYVTS